MQAYYGAKIIPALDVLLQSQSGIRDEVKQNLSEIRSLLLLRAILIGSNFIVQISIICVNWRLLRCYRIEQNMDFAVIE